MRSYDMRKRRANNEFCREIVQFLTEEGIEFLVGGTYALRQHAGIDRKTKDLDLMVRPSDVAAVVQLCRSAGYGAEVAFSHWLAKIHSEEFFIDLIFNSGNGLCAVDDEWFSRSVACVILETPVKIIPLEELIWQKAYIMERERFDGADIAHLFLKCGGRIDWEHLLDRFGPDWRVLLSHLVLFGFIYPSKRDSVPRNVMDELLRRIDAEQRSGPFRSNVCNGTFLSRNQFIFDIEADEFLDPRLSGRSAMTAEEIREWTIAGAAEQGNGNV
jgi:hypothetical protein